jgi:NodT family efflux transporter outer membrane factor (OMF) lipoprotein
LQGAAQLRSVRTAGGLALLALLLLSGCTGPLEYVKNGLKVGPNYHEPPAPVAQTWIDASDQRIRTDKDDLSQWWKVFNDPVLDDLICQAYRQNLSLRQAAFQVLYARLQLKIAVGELFPQTQQVTGDYLREAISQAAANRQFTSSGSGLKRFFNQWDDGFALSWELDFWGRLRRGVLSAEANLDASVANYDDVLVTLLADVATNYVNYRTLQKQIALTQANVELQQQTLRMAKALFKGGRSTVVDQAQAQSNLEQTAALIPPLLSQLRQANNQLCILLGIPPEDLQARLGKGDIPTAPVEVGIGIPADLLRRRPDIRKAERVAAAQSEQIGIAESAFYPTFYFNTTFGYSAEVFKNLFTPTAFQGSIGPSFQWAILNYGRILNNVRAQDAQFQSLVAAFQNTVVTAGAEVENGLAAFFQAQAQTRALAASVAAQREAHKGAKAQYQGGLTPFVTLVFVEQNLVQQENQEAQARGSIALGLIQVYRALGGGWEIRKTGCEMHGTGTPESLPAPGATGAPEHEQLPAPRLGGPRS